MKVGVFGNFYWLFIERVLRIISAFGINVLLARSMSMDEFGVLMFAQSVVMLFLVVGALGLESIVIKEVVGGNEDYKAIIGTCLILRLGFSVLLVGVLNVIVSQIGYSETQKLVIYILSASLVFHSFDVLGFYYKARMNGRLYSIVYTGVLVVGVLIKVVLFVIDAGLLWYAVSFVLDILISAVFLCVSFGVFRLYHTLWLFSWRLAKRLLVDCWPLVVSSGVIFLFSRVDQLMIESYLGAADVGVYSIAVKIADIGLVLPMVIISAYMPRVLEDKKICRDRYKTSMLRLYEILIVVALFICVVVSICADFIVQNAYGNRYGEASEALSVLIWSSVFAVMGVASTEWLISEGLQKLRLVRAVIGVVLNVVMNMIFIPRYGIIGAAFSTVIAQAVSAYFSYVFFSSGREVFLMQTKGFMCSTVFLDIKRKCSGE